MDVVTLSPPDHRLPQELMQAPGGFIWWYADAVDEQGNGFVLIWSWGLPFLPGYASSERRSTPQRPEQRPSLNLSVYKNGKLDFYSLQEFAPDDCAWDGQDTWTFGPNSITSTVEDGRRRMVANLDLPVPGSSERLEGTLSVDGVARVGNFDESSSLDHDWSPLTGPAQSSMNLKFGDVSWSSEGRGYHDRNGGRVPMHRLPFSHWLWGRLPFADKELIYYLFWQSDDSAPIALAIEISADGTTATRQDVEVSLSTPKRGLAGIWHRDLVLSIDGEYWCEVEHVSVLDDGPFYMRYHIYGSHYGELTRGVAELCVPDKIDRDLHRPLVRMRVGQAADNHNSMWLPLFTGPKSGRVERLVRSWMGA